jgi:hypothetical protein
MNNKVLGQNLNFFLLRYSLLVKIPRKSRLSTWRIKENKPDISSRSFGRMTSLSFHVPIIMCKKERMFA